MTKQHFLCRFAGMSDKPDTKYPEFGARLKAVRKQTFSTAVEAIDVMAKMWGLKGRTYFSHEKGDRMPSDAELARYAAFFGVTPEYLRYGVDDEDRVARVVVPFAAGVGSVNQISQNFDINASRRPIARHIVILSAIEIKRLISGQADLATMSGQGVLPVPASLLVSQSAFTYEIPSYDRSMVGSGVISFHPGSALVIDPDEQVLPGHYVLANVPDLPEPIVRRYDAARPYQIGVAFTLTALNEAYKPIDVAEAGQGSVIGRVMWVAFRP
jgi:hypothetical protein